MGQVLCALTTAVCGLDSLVVMFLVAVLLMGSSLSTLDFYVSFHWVIEWSRSTTSIIAFWHPAHCEPRPRPSILISVWSIALEWITVDCSLRIMLDPFRRRVTRSSTLCANYCNV